MYYSNPFDLSYLDKYDRHLLLELPSQSLYCEYRSLACCYLAFLRRLSDFADRETRTFMVGRFVSKFSDYGFEVGFCDSIINYLEVNTWLNRNTVLSLLEPFALFRLMSSIAYVISRHTVDERSFDFAYNVLLERDLTFEL